MQKERLMTIFLLWSSLPPIPLSSPFHLSENFCLTFQQFYSHGYKICLISTFLTSLCSDLEWPFVKQCRWTVQMRISKLNNMEVSPSIWSPGGRTWTQLPLPRGTSGTRGRLHFHQQPNIRPFRGNQRCNHSATRKRWQGDQNTNTEQFEQKIFLEIFHLFIWNTQQRKVLK